jgi:hypothetical protein
VRDIKPAEHAGNGRATRGPSAALDVVGRHFRLVIPMDGFARNRRNRRGPIALSLFFGISSAAYMLCLMALAILSVPLSGIGRAFGAPPRPFGVSTAILTMCSIFCPLLYFVSSYICCRPETTGTRLRYTFLASLAFLTLAVASVVFGTPVGSFSNRARVAITAVLMALPFAFASLCIFYTRWGPSSRSANDG